MLALALICTQLVAAQDNKNVRFYREGNNWVQEITGSVPAGRALKLTSDIGAVTVRGVDQPTVTYTIRKRVNRADEATARRHMDRFKVSVVRRADTVLVEGQFPDERSGRLQADFNLTVPRSTDAVRIETMGGSVSVRQIAGRVFAQTAGGSITTEDIGGSLTAETMGGSIDTGNVTGSVELNTAGGSINLGTIGGAIHAQTSGGSISLNMGKQRTVLETAGGSINVQRCSGELRASTAGGTIDIGEVGAGAYLETAGGSIRLSSANGQVSATTAGGGIELANLKRGVHAETAAGPIRAQWVSSAGFTDSHLETSVGDIVVYLPSDMKATIKAAIELANGHRIYSDFSGLKIVTEGGQWGPKEIYAEGNLNGGGPLLKVHTTNGNIEFRKR